MRALILALLVVGGGCSKKSDEAPKPKPAATVTTGTVGADGVRTIPVEVSDKGYDPERIVGKPGEKLKLVFTRIGGGSCTEELKTPDGTLIQLPMNKPVDVAVTLPKDGELGFACGMDMLRGRIVVDKS
jgi:plastocyanin domain-containing protein